MTLTEIKEEIGIKTFDLTRGTDENKKPTEWLRHWDAKRRIAVVFHQDLVKDIHSNPTMNKLAYKYEQRTTKTGDNQGTIYDQYIIIHAKSIEVSL